VGGVRGKKGGDSVFETTEVGITASVGVIKKWKKISSSGPGCRRHRWPGRGIE